MFESSIVSGTKWVCDSVCPLNKHFMSLGEIYMYLFMKLKAAVFKIPLTIIIIIFIV